MKIRPETKAILEAAAGAKVSARLLGSVDGAYLVLRELPATYGNMDFILRYGEQVVLRFLQEGTIIGFRTYVLNMVKEPERLLFVAYPKEVQRYALRRADRIKCTLPCQLYVLGVQLPGIVADLSETGCQCVIRRRPELEQDWGDCQELAGEPVEIEAVGLNKDMLQLFGTVRRVVVDEQALRLGIQFEVFQTELFQSIVDALEPLQYQ